MHLTLKRHQRQPMELAYSQMIVEEQLPAATVSMLRVFAGVADKSDQASLDALEGADRSELSVRVAELVLAAAESITTDAPAYKLAA